MFHKTNQLRYILTDGWMDQHFENFQDVLKMYTFITFCNSDLSFLPLPRR